MNELLAFSIISFFLVLSPGLNSILILKTVSARGKRAGFENIVGLVIATFLHGAISLLGLSAIILQSAELFTAVKLLGAAYLLYLGIKTIAGSFQKSDNPVIMPAELSRTSGRTKNSIQNVLEGFLTQSLNPKVSIFYLAAFPQFLDFQTATMLEALSLVAIHAAMIAAWFILCSIVIDRMKHSIKQERSSRKMIGRWVQRLSGGFLVYFGALLVTQEGTK